MTRDREHSLPSKVVVLRHECTNTSCKGPAAAWEDMGDGHYRYSPLVPECGGRTWIETTEPVKVIARSGRP